ncbi:MAG: mechanosensitive ion channel family protein, partial [Proteobacteria bacterium]|nr:mechanosensitive ion channel family protein [Pseudomonadota bacterium]MBU1611336.1 mechanosensitive ion channel family protein [Pseudomonadota bacterium]
MDVLTQFYSQESLLRDLTVLAGILVAGWLVFLVVRRVLVALVRQVSRRTTFAWDDIVVEAGVFGSLALVAPAVVLALGAGILESWGALLSNAANLLLLLAAVGVADRLLTAVLRIYQLRPDSARRPIKGPVQLVKIFVYLMSAVAAIAFVLGKSPWGLLSGIGAFTAVLLLVFRDTILSFVAGMQIVTGDLVRQGDWLEVPAFGADGDV